MISNKKQRLDQLILQQNPTLSRTYIQSLIMQGKVKVEGAVVTKPGTPVSVLASLTLDMTEPRYVSRAGYKLEKALEEFQVDVTDLVVLDAGLSTGGFTDCLLQRGARKIYGIDVGYGQVHEKIRANERVIVMERTNLRHLALLPEPVDLVTLDLSFISIIKVLDAVLANMKEGGKVITLIKPQFEASRHQIGAGGIVRDEAVHLEVIQKVVNAFAQHGLHTKNVIPSPITGTDGNKEFLALFS